MVTFEFACRDDCLNRMVPSDLRALVAERDRLRAELAEAKEAVAAEREACAELVDGLSSGPYALSGREIVEAIRARDISETCAQFIRLRAHIDASKVEDYE